MDGQILDKNGKYIDATQADIDALKAAGKRFKSRGIKTSDGGWKTIQIQFTDKQEAASDASEAASLAAKPMNDWLAAMGATDVDMPRYVEDIVSAMDSDSIAKIPAITLDKYNNKRNLRAQKP